MKGRPQPAARPILEGDFLENVRFAAFVGPEQRQHASLRQIVAGGCGLLISFVSTCPFCEDMASEWAGVSSITTKRGNIRAAWIAVSITDSGALDFVRRHDLAQPWYALRTPNDRRVLGITGWPTLYLVSPEGRYEGEISSRDPGSAELVAAAERCLHGVEQTGGSE